LTSKEKQQIEKSIYPQTLVCAGIVRLYRTKGQPWEYTGIVGIAIFARDPVNGRNNILILDIRNYKKIFEQELYYNFKYDLPKSFFHTFEVTDCVAGLSFADEKEARVFGSAVKSSLPIISRRISAQISQSNVNTTNVNTTTVNTTPLPPSSSKREEKKSFGRFFKKIFKGKKEEQEFEISGPTNFRHESHIGWDPVNGFDIKNIPAAWKKLFKEAGIKKK